MLLTDEEEHKATGSNPTYQNRLNMLLHLNDHIKSKAKIDTIEAAVVAVGYKLPILYRICRYSVLF